MLVCDLDCGRLLGISRVSLVLMSELRFACRYASALKAKFRTDLTKIGADFLE
jgi:hypothetical protein